MMQWWRRRREQHAQRQTEQTAAFARLSREIDTLGSQFRAHAIATDARLDLHDVLLQKSLVDLNKAIKDQAAALHRLADLWAHGPPREEIKEMTLHKEA